MYIIHINTYNKFYNQYTLHIPNIKDIWGYNLATEILTLVKIPITEVENWIREKYKLPPVLADYKLEEDTLILQFSQDENLVEVTGPESSNEAFMEASTSQRRRRTHKKRNRMKTRGWVVVARITNAKGQKCTIYRPFVDALQDSTLSEEQQKKKVEEILKANRNKPSAESIQYFLENTLEYLRGQR
jgi:hypothetical protein